MGILEGWWTIKWCVAVLVFLSVSPCIFSKQQGRDDYFIVNRSNENISFSFRTKEINYTGNYSYVDYYRNGEMIGRITILTQWQFNDQQYYESTRIVPYRNSHIDGVLSWNYSALVSIDRIKRLYIDPDNAENGEDIFRDIDGFTIKFITLNGKELFDNLIDEFIVYDEEGNIIMTLDDITENSFTEDYVVTSAYTDSNSENAGDTRLQDAIFITPEILEKKKKKYAGQPVQ
jgi:hypothetical protein